MKVMVADRQEGKTTKLVEWVQEGEPTETYPFYSRIILVPNLNEADRVRREHPSLYYRQVYSLGEWQNAVIGVSPVEIGIDNVDMMLTHALNLGGRHPVGAVTMTGEAWS